MILHIGQGPVDAWRMHHQRIHLRVSASVWLQKGVIHSAEDATGYLETRMKNILIHCRLSKDNPTTNTDAWGLWGCLRQHPGE